MKNRLKPFKKKLKRKLGKRDKKSKIYIALGKKKEELGRILYFRAKDSDGDRIPAAVGIGPDGKIVKAVLFSHHEENLAAKDSFLKQFVGKGAEDDWHPGHTIKLVEGSKQYSWQVAKGIRKTLLINQMVGTKHGMKKTNENKEKKHKHHGKESEPHAH